MSGTKTARRLAAILVSDVVGYSALMGKDEAGTLAALKRHRELVFDPAVSAHSGRLVKLMGDGALVEFGSVVDAVNCALAIQRAPGEGPIKLRIGINLGDIIVDGDDIYGDGVNVAARLEPLAEPGGICVAAIVHESLGSRVDAAFHDVGEVKVKNIAHAVRVWKWSPTSETGGPPSATAARSERAPVPSLVVLPFQNFGTDPEQGYFADGIVEDLITALSRFRSFTVIARNSAFAYKDRAIDVRQLAHNLGARYVLEGSVRRSGQRLRVTAQLIDGASGGHLWAQNFDGSVDDIFDVQDRITESVVGLVAPQIQQAELERSRRERPESMDAYDLYLRGSAKLNTLRPEDSAEGLALLNHARELDPTFAGVISSMAWGYEHRIQMGWPPLGPNDEQHCLELARKAMALARDDAAILAHGAIIVQLVAHEFDQGLSIIERAVALNPNNVTVAFFAGVAHLKGGSLETAIEHFRHAMRLNPGESDRSLAGVAYAEICLGRFEAALDNITRSLAFDANFGLKHWILIACYIHLGRTDEARHAYAAYRATAPDATLGRIRRGMQSKDPQRLAVLVEGLRQMGMPE